MREFRETRKTMIYRNCCVVGSRRFPSFPISLGTSGAAFKWPKCLGGPVPSCDMKTCLPGFRTKSSRLECCHHCSHGGICRVALGVLWRCELEITVRHPLRLDALPQLSKEHARLALLVNDDQLHLLSSGFSWTNPSDLIALLAVRTVKHATLFAQRHGLF